MQKIAIYTIDYLPERERLMPWRTVAEVAKHIHGRGYDVTIVNGISGDAPLTDYETDGVPVIGIRHDYSDLVAKVKEMGITALAVPVTWRDGLKDWNAFKTIDCKKVAYFAGGAYRTKDAWKLWRGSSLGMAKPYLLESLVPKRILTKKLVGTGFMEIIGLTSLTAGKVGKCPPLKVSYILPGKDPFETLADDTTILKKYGLEGKKFLCYTGAPSPVRGSEWLLKAADKVTANDFKLVMLMRTDVGSDFQRFEQKHKQMKHPDRVLVISDRLTRNQLKTVFSNAYAMVLPFIVIPSEIPLTYYEVLSCGTPVITFPNGGTTAYLKGLAIAKKSVKGLALKMDDLWENAAHRKVLAKEALECMTNHPTWEETGNQWLNLLTEK